MPRMLELVRASALSSHQMMTASKGALSVPAEEMVEILVYIAEHNKIMGETARLTLAGWEESSAKAIAANPNSPKEILDYWVSARDLRPTLFPLLLENSSVSNRKLGELASTVKGEWIDAMIASPRVRSSRILLADLNSNKELSEAQAAQVKELFTVPAAEPAPIAVAQAAASAPVQVAPAPNPQIVAAAGSAAAAAPELAPLVSHPGTDSETDPETDLETEDALVAFFTEHASEIAAEGDKPFQPIGYIHEEMPTETEARSLAAAASADAVASTPAPAVAPVIPTKRDNPENEKRGSVLQKINKLDVRGRIQLAMKGNKEERSILVRDGTKIVAIAVLDSPKISDGEVEKFAGQKNVLEAVLRAIPLKRRFMKNYPVVRNLVFNPRTPLDLSLGLMKNILIADLKNLMGNKEVADTIRKMAMRTYKQKSEQAGKK
jgi:hypothetical protein